MANKYQVGDKLLIEFEITRAYRDGSFHAKRKGSTVEAPFHSQVEVHTHTPKPVEPARGQLWYDSDQDYSNHVIACEDGWVMYRNTSSNQPHVMPVGTFRKAKRYVSG